MEFDDAKSVLKEGYLALELELVDEHQMELFLKHPRGNTNVRISEQEITEFAEFDKFRTDFENQPTECSMCSVNYREHMINFSEYGRRRFHPGRDRNYIFGELSDTVQYAEIGSASNLFVNYFRFDSAFAQLTIERLRRPYVRGRVDEGLDMQTVLFRPLTIRIHNINAPNVDTAIKRTAPIIDTCLFELSYLKNLTLTLQDDWPRRQSRVRPFQFGDRFTGDEFPLQRVSFNPDIIRFYQRGMSTDDPFIQFLSFYHVLEYYFVAISDEQLYSRLSQRINDPRFSTSPSYLNRLIQDTLTHKRETDETEMLKNVLLRFVDEVELIEFIRAYEDYLNDRLYSKRRTIFGDTNEIRLTSGHVIGNLSKRIKIVRNALVHSSDRYERKQRYIPTTKSETMIGKEIPLMKFLAERVIIGSAELYKTIKRPNPT